MKLSAVSSSSSPRRLLHLHGTGQIFDNNCSGNGFIIRRPYCDCYTR